MKTQQQKLSQYAKDNHVPVMMEDGLAFLLDQVRQAKVKNFLEIGTAIGKTAIAVASLDPEIQVVTIERDPKMIEAAKINIAESGLASQITLIEGDALEVMKTLGGPYDLIFLDAAKGQYIRYLPEVLRLLDREGVLLADNVLKGGEVIESRFAVERRNRTIHSRMREFLYELKHHEELQTSILPLGDGVALSVRCQRNDRETG